MIEFNEELHLYFDNDKLVPSVNQILDVVYGSSVSGAPDKFLKPATAKGTKFHKEVDVYLKTGKQGESKEFSVWHEWFSFIGDFLVNYESEKIVYAETPYGCFAGTIDLLERFVWDWKTCKTISRKQLERYQKQISMYIYAARKMGYAVNEPGKIVHITDKVEILNVEYLGDKWVEKTMALYKDIQNGEKTQEQAILAQQKALEKVSAKDIKALETKLLKIVELENQVKEIKERIKEEMGNRGIYSLKFGKVSFTYVSEHVRHDFDKKTFEEDEPELYASYLTEVKVKPGLRVKIED